jgi:translation initiation factor IF-3
VEYELNYKISIPRFVVIDEEGNNLGELDKMSAINVAKERELDLVLVSPNSVPPVARILDWTKFKYEKNKKSRQNKKQKTELKEWWFKPQIEERDMEVKINQIRKFIDAGGQAKITVKSVRRTPYLKMDEVFEKIKEKVVEFAEIIADKTREGSNITMRIQKNK